MIIDTVATMGAVLAGGESRRLGRDKAGVELGGRTLVARAVATLSDIFTTVVVVSAGREDLVGLGVEVVPDRQAGQGPLGGIGTALRRAEGESIFVLACDMPFVSADLVGYVIKSVGDERSEEPEMDSPVAAVPRWMGRLQPLCAIYGAEALPYVDQALAAGALGVLDLLATVSIDVIDIGPHYRFAHPDPFMNINRPLDLEKARKLFVERTDPR